MTKRILIIGATSAIATACARQWAGQKARFFLVGRNAEKLQQTADDLVARGAQEAHAYILDMNHFDALSKMLDACFSTLKEIDVALLAHGTLPDQKACEENAPLAIQEFSNNGLSFIVALTFLANRMEEQKFGTIAVISSVAGDRGRPSNYLYGSAKAAVTTFCEGLRSRLFKSGVHVLTIKPGFVDTPMTKELSLPTLLMAKPEKVAVHILKAIERKKNVIYTPPFWSGIMLIIRLTPQIVFKRLSL